MITAKFRILIYLAKWLSHSFDRMILRKKEGEEAQLPSNFLGYLKRKLEFLIFYERFH